MDMDIYSEKHSVQRIIPDGKEKPVKNFIWDICTAFVLSVGAIESAMYSWWSSISMSVLSIATLAVTVVCCTVAQTLRMKGKRSAAVLADILPVPFVLVVTGFRGYGVGCLTWINTILQHLNEANNGGIALFKVNASANDIFHFELLLILIICEGAWHLIFGKKVMLTCLFCIIWIVLPVMGGYFRAISAAFLVAVLIMTLISGVKQEILKRDIVWCLCVIAAVGGSAFITSEKVSDFVDSLRNETVDTIYEMRYGQENMVCGDMREAAKLHESDDSMFNMKSGQEKNIYLRAFAAGDYRNGVWSEFPNSLYSGENAGMMEWLRNKGFDPMTQTAEYYSLSENDKVPEKNNISLTITDAARENLYVPASLEKIYRIRYGTKNDSRLTSKGLVGARIYSYDEVSGTRPSELTVPDSWVSSPENEKQRVYSEAEAVYREFVYNNYTSINRNIYDIVNSMFWDDYDDENDGVYSAVCRVRDVLEQTVRYTEEPDAAPVDRDAIIWFLTEAREGNAVMYASAAVEALRAHGIPARYAEGYYISAEDISASGSGTVDVTGQDMHAWAEVYFDGVGWMPVDTTPGYYYNVAALQEMVSAPDTVRQTAAIDDDQSQFQDITDSGIGNTSSGRSAVQKIENATIMLAGAVAILIVILALLLCALEIARAIFIVILKKRYRSDSHEQRVRELEKRIFHILELRGVEARLGWKSNEIDDQISEKCSNVKNGEYLRVCSILEKAVYGGIALEQYEERTLSTFLQKISEPEKSSKWTTRIRMRYMGII